ncbi:hypothetical protein [Streptomyces anandii]|uniref:hypothetical protein n=1 Tax=Streptomyces anandii TaxID=285454 RepID=UPI0037B4D28F
MVGGDNTDSPAMCRRLGSGHVRDVVGDDGTVTELMVTSTRRTLTPAARPSGSRDPA